MVPTTELCGRATQYHTEVATVITQGLLSLLWCPTCRSSGLRAEGLQAGQLPMDQGELVCDACGSRYPVENGVPALMPRDGTNTEAWDLWRRHIEKFQARREDRIANPTRLVTRSMSVSRPNEPFAAFTGIKAGRVLDIGCGPGKFRFNFDESNVEYVGLDPIVLPEIGDFPFVRGLAEYLPFANGTFTDVVVLAALDHFRDTARFFQEARRVLTPNGRLHILQSVHDLDGPVSAVKVLTHKVKDVIEDWNTNDHGSDVPKHLSEYTRRSLMDVADPYFSSVRTEEFSAAWYSPTKLFLTLSPRKTAFDGVAMDSVGASSVAPPL